MREIKFRVFNKEENKMYYNAQDTYDWNVCPEPSFGEVLNNDDYIVMQYTGLKDKNGKEIYEGDIIEGGYLNPLTDEFHSKKYLVEFKNGYFKGKNIKNSPFGDTWLWFIQGEVIGNIYENLDT